MKVEALLFNLNGVLVDVSQSTRYAIKKTAEFFTGDEIQNVEIQQVKNRGGYNNDLDCTHAIISDHGKDAYHWEIVDKFEEFYLGKNFDGFIRNETILIKPEVLSSLFHRFKLGIVTERPKSEVDFVLSRFEAENYFDVLVAQEDTPPGRGKPEPDGILLAMQKLGVKTAAYLGNTIDDMRAATAAKIVPVGILPFGETEKNQADLLRAAGAKFILNDVNEAMTLFD
ncbi:hypothetical protein B6D60_02755 [candidate division KSB1 bacterium 4484_87]|nr:MAG: hypothetical protein B6D60_02755 [candidate division KSB1 bacterium 4484_87]